MLPSEHCFDIMPSVGPQRFAGHSAAVVVVVAEPVDVAEPNDPVEPFPSELEPAGGAVVVGAGEP